MPIAPALSHLAALAAAWHFQGVWVPALRRERLEASGATTDGTFELVKAHSFVGCISLIQRTLLELSTSPSGSAYKSSIRRQYDLPPMPKRCVVALSKSDVFWTGHDNARPKAGCSEASTSKYKRYVSYCARKLGERCRIRLTDGANHCGHEDPRCRPRTPNQSGG